jgi:uncharacterized coiled-coil DUF342 family protein
VYHYAGFIFKLYLLGIIMKKANSSKAITTLSERIKKTAAQLKDLREKLKELKAAEKATQDNGQPAKKAAGKKSVGKKAGKRGRSANA